MHLLAIRLRRWHGQLILHPDKSAEIVPGLNHDLSVRSNPVRGGVEIISRSSTFAERRTPVLGVDAAGTHTSYDGETLHAAIFPALSRSFRRLDVPSLTSRHVPQL